MSPCVSEETLLAFYEGDASPETRAHLAKCQICTLRYEHLVKDLKLLGQVLRDPPPQPTQVHVQRLSARRWVPFVTASAATATLLLGYLLWPDAWRPLSPLPSLRPVVVTNEVQDEDLARFLSKVVAPAVFTKMELGARELPKHTTSLAYLQAALDGGWPQERCEGEQTQGCDNDPFALLFEEEN
jgi:hypothetical protein